jgi:hypothetical protein
MVIGRDYFARQAATLLKLAKSTSDPGLAGVLIDKATDLRLKAEGTSPPPERSSRAPDVEAET